MSLLGFLFERNNEQRAPDAEGSQSVEPVGVSTMDGDESFHGEPNIDQIRDELAEIAKLIGPGDSYNMLAETDVNMTCVEVAMGEIKQMVPHAFSVSRITDVADEKTVSILFGDLFDQLQSGTVEVTIAQLLADVAEEHRAENFHDIKEDKAVLPLQIVLNSVRPEELSKRTTKVERDPELANMPDVFSLPGLSSRDETPAVTESRIDTEEACAVRQRGAIPFRPASASADEAVEEQKEAQEPADQDLGEEAAAAAPDVSELPEVHRQEPSEPKLASREEVSAEAAVQEEQVVEESRTEEAVVEEATPTFEIPESIPLAVEETVEETVEEAVDEAVEERTEETVAEEPAVPAFEIPESFEGVQELPAEDLPAEAAFSGFEIPPSAPEEPVEAVEAAASLSEPLEDHPSLADLDRLMQQAERDAKPSEYNPPVDTVPVLPAFASGEEVLVRNLDLNRASAEDLVSRLDGIGPKLAIRIVQDREINGGFADLYDLARVQGIGAKIFESMTGLVWREDLCGSREILANILDSSTDSIPDIKGVARRIAETKGFEGCVIAHNEGYVLASSWDHSKNEALGAFAPQMFKKVVDYISRLELGGMDAFTFFFDEFPITLVSHGDLILAAIHSPNRYSRRHVQIARTLTAELSRRLQRIRDI